MYDGSAGLYPVLHPHSFLYLFFLLPSHVVLIHGVLEEDITPSIKVVSGDTAHHATALQLLLETSLFISQLCKTVKKKKNKKPLTNNGQRSGWITADKEIWVGRCAFFLEEGKYTVERHALKGRVKGGVSGASSDDE